jgi:hypothetical protein
MVKYLPKVIQDVTQLEKSVFFNKKHYIFLSKYLPSPRILREAFLRLFQKKLLAIALERQSTREERFH